MNSENRVLRELLLGQIVSAGGACLGYVSEFALHSQLGQAAGFILMLGGPVRFLWVLKRTFEALE